MMPHVWLGHEHVEFIRWLGATQETTMDIFYELGLNAQVVHKYTLAAPRKQSQLRCK